MRNIIIILVICFYISLSSVGHAEVDKVELKQSVKSNSVGLSWQFEYDDTGRIIKSVDPAGRQTKIHHEFDNNKQIREVMKELPDSSKVTYKFDDFGRRISMTDTYGTVRYKYDGFSRLTEVRRDGQQGISYTYDTMDRLKSVSLGKGLTMSYSYDFLGRLVKINTPAGGISYEYLTGQGMVIRTLPNGIRTD
nr:RHS repeat protein [Fodinibius sp.]NIX01795.1 hypothetical protein [Phycisphaerae bacterium]NIY27138.1 hypothetical protein [Fodinibius sp.]